MAAHKKEEASESPAKKQPEHPPAGSPPASETKPVVKDQAKENMEVHHHAQHEGKKSWKAYFWEFFMLFLAVTAGFFVENQREHYVEQKRAKEYIRSFVEDLKTDTVRFSRTLGIYQKLQAELSELYPCYTVVIHNQDATDCLKYIFEATHGFADLVYSEGTLQQLKNAGGLRLLDGEDADSITRYDAFLRFVLKAESTSMQEKASQVRNTRSVAFVFSETLDTNFNKITTVAKLEMLSGNKELVNRFFNDALAYRGAMGLMTDLITKLHARATRLIVFFTKKYQME